MKINIHTIRSFVDFLTLHCMHAWKNMLACILLTNQNRMIVERKTCASEVNVGDVDTDVEEKACYNTYINI